VDSALEALHLDRTGTLEAPADFARPGWYADGTVPGDTGPAVIAGHVDSKRGPAVFYRLDQLRKGDVIQVQRGGVWLSFHVVATGRYPKDAFPTAAVYGPTPDAELRLITCGGQFDETRRSYLDNTVVYAVAG
jgi:LPXTG-site transpeptidase (sortase) family protein